MSQNTRPILFHSTLSQESRHDAVANHDGCELISPKGICSDPVDGQVELENGRLISNSSPYPLNAVVGSPVILSAQKT